MTKAYIMIVIITITINKYTNHNTTILITKKKKNNYKFVVYSYTRENFSKILETLKCIFTSISIKFYHRKFSVG